MRRRFVSVVSVSMVTFLSVACSTREAGTPTSTGSPPTNASNPSKAPRVAHPLDASAFTTSTCSALTNRDLAALNLTGAQSKSTATADSPDCTWQWVSKTVATDIVSDGIAWLTPDTDGLSNVYSRRSTEAYFVVTNVEGYPAVYASEADLRDGGTCVLNVGVNDRLFFFVDYQRNDITSSEANAQQSCGAAEQTAAAVIRNLQSRQGS